LSALGSVSDLLTSGAGKRLIRRFGRRLTTELLREVQADVRARARRGGLSGRALQHACSARGQIAAVERAAEDLLAPRPQPVINATGVVVHTNLGRSVLSDEAARQVAAAATGYLDLEYDVGSGGRGSRMDHLAPLMERLFPGHGFLVVNNNAAATMLCLRALSRAREVIVSRGELVEIGGSFRVPDILAASGARLREVGTTNRTRVTDFEAAITDKTGLLLKVHTSNFRIVGFTESPTIASLARLAKKRDLPLVVDWGSGDLIDLAPLDIHDEMPALDVLEAGADLVTFSGDKLLGGPQAGFVVGREQLIAKLRRDPLARVCRLDRLLVSALQRTLAAYVTGRALDQIPTLRMLAVPAAAIGRRARKLVQQLNSRIGEGNHLSVIKGESRTGGGTSPAGERPTFLISIGSPTGDAGAVERRLRANVPPVIGRMHDGRLLLDLRTVPREQDELLLEVLATTLRH
jgi:L-seryl-tRNA(Ser) seleniumtransferase